MSPSRSDDFEPSDLHVNGRVWQGVHTCGVFGMQRALAIFLWKTARGHVNTPWTGRPQQKSHTIGSA